MILPPLGIPKSELDTPALCVDLDSLQANIEEAQALCRRHRVQWRPHAKSHKSPDIARRLIETGAMGLTCAKLGEAEVFAASGIADLLVANLIAGPKKIERLIALRRVADPIICLDHFEQAEPISRTMHAAGLRVRAVLEIDIGMQRAGVAPGEAALKLAQRLADLPGIELAGVMGYEGHLLLIENQDEKARAIRSALSQLVATKDLLEASGIHCPIVSCGGTGSFPFAAAYPGITEVQAGGVIFMDAFYRHQCRVEGFRYALTILSTVVSRPAPERAIIDAGRKTMNIELHMPLAWNREGVQVERLSAEHGILKLGPAARDLRIGERLELVPGYGDFTTVLHNQFFVFQDDRLVDIWPLAARGMLT